MALHRDSGELWSADRNFEDHRILQAGIQAGPADDMPDYPASFSPICAASRTVTTPLPARRMVLFMAIAATVSLAGVWFSTDGRTPWDGDPLAFMPAAVRYGAGAGLTNPFYRQTIY